MDSKYSTQLHPRRQKRDWGVGDGHIEVPGDRKDGLDGIAQHSITGIEATFELTHGDMVPWECLARLARMMKPILEARDLFFLISTGYEGNFRMSFEIPE